MSASNSLRKPKKLELHDYTVGWISALSLELSAAILMLDEEHERLACQGKDKNTYVFGQMGKHNVVIACLPEGSYGTISAVSVAQDMVRSFGSIRFGLMVGIGAGIPSNQHQIQLGDVVVSTPTDTCGGVVQYDLGKIGGDGQFTRKGSLNKPPQVLLTAVSVLKAKHKLGREKLGPLLKALQVEDFENPEDFQYQGTEFDRLFQGDYLHSGYAETCDSCDMNKLNPRLGDRPRPKNNEPRIHHGIIASGNQLVRHTVLREQLRQDCNACCIEMEAAGLMDNFPCLVIRGITDYADSHKNDRWQQYAALTAAAYAKRLLSVISPEQVEVTPTVKDAMEKVSEILIEVASGVKDVYAKVDQVEKTNNFHQKEQRDQALFNWLSPLKFSSRHDTICHDYLQGTGKWMLDHVRFHDWRSVKPKSRALCCFGEPGAGKTFITSLVIETLRKDVLETKTKMGLAYVYCDYNDQDQTVEKLIAAIAKQLLLPLNIPERIVEIYEEHQKKGEPISLDNATEILPLVCAAFDRVYICIDALDELKESERNTLLKSLQETPPLVYLFTTGRNHTKATVRRYFEEAEVFQIEASESDVRSLIRHNISDSRTKEPDLMDETLEYDITERIVATSAGNFLLPASQIQFVLDGDTKSERRSNLEKLPASIEKAFNVTIQRIQLQSPARARRGMQILTWVYLAKRLLSVEELLHALATKKGHSDLDRNNFVSRNTYLDNCLGLVIMDEQTSTVRLVHKSLQDYLSKRSDLFRNGHSMIAQICLTYLMFRSVITHSEAMASKAENSKSESNGLALVEYAACEWGYHLRKSGQEEQLVVKLAQTYFFMELRKRYWSQWLLCNHIYNINPIFSNGSFVVSVSKLHIAAYFGIHSVLSDKLIIAASELNSKDSYYGLTPLSWAAKSGWEVVAKLLLENGAELESKDNDGKTPLLLAARDGQEAVVKLLLEKGAEPDSKDGFDRTPLLWAARNGHEAVAKLLLEKRVNINAKDKNGTTVLHWVAWKGHEGVISLLLENGADTEIKNKGGGTPLVAAVENKSEAVINLLLAKGAKTDCRYKLYKGRSVGRSSIDYDREPASYVVLDEYVFGYPGYLPEDGERYYDKSDAERFLYVDVSEFLPVQEVTPLSRSAEMGNEVIVKLLLDQGADIGTKNGDGQTALHVAAVNGHEEIVRLLLERKADVGTKNGDGRTALHVAAVSGHEEIVRLLLERKADVDAKTNLKSTALYGATWKGYEAVMQLLLKANADVDVKTNDGLTALYRAAENGHEAGVRLLLDAKAEVNVETNKGQTALYQAAWKRHEAVVRLLLEAKADVDVKTNEGQTALYRAAENGHEALVRLLLEAKADVDVKTNEGHTALYRAAENGHEAVVRLLLQNSANAEMKVGGGGTPLAAAIENKSEAVMKLLLAKGAKVNYRYRLYTVNTAAYRVAAKRFFLHKAERERKFFKGGMKYPYYSGDDHDEEDRTLLSRAAEIGNEAVVKLLLDYRADVAMEDGDGRTALYVAAEGGHEGVVQQLLDHDANTEIKIEGGRTPLAAAIENKSEAVIKLLLAKGAKVNYQYRLYEKLYSSCGGDVHYHIHNTGKERSPLSRAIENGDEIVVELLLEKGAKP